MKRLFDILLAVFLIILLSPFFVLVVLWMLVTRDLPVFFVSERMKAPGKPFQLVKFRTMLSPEKDDVNTGVSGGDKATRITKLGHVLRRYRLDETPQLWNVLKGEISFVGPRPPLRRYTERFPEVYESVLSVKPGITGLASLVIHGFEERVLAEAQTSEETERLYVRRCIPRKAHIDMIYIARDGGVCFDMLILWLTVKRVFGRRLF